MKALIIILIQTMIAIANFFIFASLKLISIISENNQFNQSFNLKVNSYSVEISMKNIKINLIFSIGWFYNEFFDMNLPSLDTSIFKNENLVFMMRSGILVDFFDILEVQNLEHSRSLGEPTEENRILKAFSLEDFRWGMVASLGLLSAALKSLYISLKIPSYGKLGLVLGFTILILGSFATILLSINFNNTSLLYGMYCGFGLGIILFLLGYSSGKSKELQYSIGIGVIITQILQLLASIFSHPDISTLELQIAITQWVAISGLMIGMMIQGLTLFSKKKSVDLNQKAVYGLLGVTLIIDLIIGFIHHSMIT